MITSRSIWAAWRSEPGEEVEMKAFISAMALVVMMLMAAFPFVVIALTWMAWPGVSI